MLVVVVVVVLVLVLVLVLVVVVVVVVVVVATQNGPPVGAGFSHTYALRVLQDKSFHAPGFLLCEIWPMIRQFSATPVGEKLDGSMGVLFMAVPIHKQSTSCVQQPLLPEEVRQPAYPPAL